MSIKLQMARQFLGMGLHNRAKTLLQQVIDEQPGNPDAAISLGILYSKQGEPERAIDCLQRALAQEPANVHVHLQLGDVYRDHGRLEEAATAYRHALSVQPDNLHALYNLALLTVHTEYTNEVRALETHFRNPGLGHRERRALGFTLGKIFDDLGEYDRAFGYFAEANWIAKAQYTVSIPEQIRYFAQVRQIFDAAWVRRHANAGPDDDSPIFVTGMPRSGTSLVEQILASHPQVFGAGERENFPNAVQAVARETGLAFPDGFSVIDSAVLHRKATDYLSEMKALTDDAPCFVDKGMSNVRFVALIASMLPGARIVHCIRNPRDQGLSCFQKDFGASQPYSFDLAEIGIITREYLRTMEHWDTVLPGKVYRLSYEDLVQDLETQVRQLLDHCGLPFDARCLAFHDTRRQLNTFSLAQVRQPLYSSAIGRWKNYARQLQPLIDALETPGRD